MLTMMPPSTNDFMPRATVFLLSSCAMVLRMQFVISACKPGTEIVVKNLSGAGAMASLFMSCACVPCPANHYRQTGHSWYCQRCPPGHISDVGSETCAKPGEKICPKGQYDCALASQGCVDCLSGEFKSLYGSGVCAPCPVNTFAVAPASFKCTACRRGEVSAVRAACQLAIHTQTHAPVLYTHSCAHTRILSHHAPPGEHVFTN